ncbi:MAG: TRAP transporter large permease subunit [Proteobacteria bacterium]|nr:TRAP transporter large permease subunit [Pseudomonadota bacterium]MBU1688976.1 TRAP transporter large permease subunit [Pseudomonadota bacterium]
MIVLKILPVILALLGTPLFIVIAALALLSFHGAEVDLSVVTIAMARLSDTPLLLSLPLFIFAGTLLSDSGTPGRILALSKALLGWLPGGLGVITLLISAVFTAFTGASGVTIFALGGLLFPAMIKDRYSEKFSLGLITTAGSLGLLFPPSLPLILYGVVSGARVDHLFLAGLLPGLLMLVLLAGYTIKVGQTIPAQKFVFSQIEIKKALREAIWELPLPFIIFGGIYGGFFVVGEAAAITALYVILIEVFIYRDIPIRSLPAIMAKSTALFGGIFMVLAASMASTDFLIDQQIPNKLFTLIQAHITSKYSFLLLLNIFLLIVGALLDIFSALILVVPLIIPIAEAYGINMVHLGIIFLTNLQIGYCTPPVGLNLFLASYRFDQPIFRLYRATIPFLGLLLLTLIIITYVPQLSLFLIELLN